MCMSKLKCKKKLMWDIDVKYYEAEYVYSHTESITLYWV